MSFYQKLARKPKQFLTLTGIELSEFARLLPALQAAYGRPELTRKTLTVRDQQVAQRQPGGGAQYRNDLPARGLLWLLYYRLYLTQEFLAFLFKASAKSVICRGSKSVRAAGPVVLPWPACVRAQLLPAARAVAKQQCHTHKQLRTTTRSGLIVAQSLVVGSKAHAFKVFKEAHASRGVFKERVGLRVTDYADSGFQGLPAPGLPVASRVVNWATRNHPLTRAEAAINRYRSSQRLANNHLIGRRKQYQLAAQEYRQRAAHYDLTLEISAGRVKLRVLKRISQRTGAIF